MMTKEPVTVDMNPYGGTIYIGKDKLACILVTQRLYNNKPKRGMISGEVRMAQLSDDMVRVLSLDLKAGDRLTGKIVIKKCDDIQWSYYSEDTEDEDEDMDDVSSGL